MHSYMENFNLWKLRLVHYIHNNYGGPLLENAIYIIIVLAQQESRPCIHTQVENCLVNVHNQEVDT